MKNEDIYSKAKQRVKAKKGFYYHLISYAGTLVMLNAIMYLENNGDMTPVIIVALSWGIGLVLHYFNTFGMEHLDGLGFNSNWEEEALEKEIETLERKRELRERISQEKAYLDTTEHLDLKELEKRKLDKY